MSTENDPLQQLDLWYQRPLGRLVAASIEQKLETELAESFGYHALQIGLPCKPQFFHASPIPYKLIMHSHPAQGVDLIGDGNQIPLAESSLDMLMLPHVLELVDDPAALLADAFRVLIPEGRLVIIGFNPVSWWGLLKCLLFRAKKAPWRGRFYTLLKLRRLLIEYDFQIERSTTFFYRPPVRNSRLAHKFLFMETLGRLLSPIPGGLYMLTARKQVHTPTRIKPIWTFRRFVVGKRCVQPTS